MKKFSVYFLLFCLIVILSCENESLNKDINSQSNKAVQTNSGIDRIDNYIQQINAISERSSILKKDLYRSTEGGEVKFYNWNGKLKKIESIDFGETLQKKSIYYLKNDSLIAVFTEIIIYNRPIYYDSTAMIANNDEEVFDIQKSTKSQTKYYFTENKLFKLTGNQIETLQQNSKQSLQFSQELSELIHLYNN